MPDPEEQISDSPYLQQQVMFLQQTVLLAGDGFSLDTLQLPDRLQRLYGALGRNDKVLEIELAQADAGKAVWNQAEVDQIARRFSAAGQSQRFADLATDFFHGQIPRARANLAWQLQWTNAAVTNAALAAPTDEYGSLREEWRGDSPRPAAIWNASFCAPCSMPIQQTPWPDLICWI